MSLRIALIAGFIGAAAPAYAQTIGRGVEADVSWIRFIGALILCLLLAAGAALAMRARVQGTAGVSAGRLDLRRVTERLRTMVSKSRNERLTVIETTWLGNNVSVSVLRCDGRDYLVGTTPQGRVFIRPLAEANEPDPT